LTESATPLPLAPHANWAAKHLVDWRSVSKGRSGSGRARFVVALAATTVVAGGLFEPLSQSTPDPSPVDVAAARRLPCTRAGIGTALMAFAGLVNEQRFGATRLVWLPRKRLPTPAFFGVPSIAGNRPEIRARRGAELAAATQAWVADGFRLVEVIHIDARPSRREPAGSGAAIAWVRSTGDPADGVLLGRGKGVFDCEKQRVAMWYGGERQVADETSARELAGGQCRTRPRNTTLRRYGQTAVLCGLPRGYRG
jgi:hypothetical protein